MEFATRDRYRHATERIAKQGGLTEAEVAAKAIELASASAADKGIADRAAHVGFYLIDKGLSELERAAAVDVSTLDCAETNREPDFPCLSFSVPSRRSQAFSPRASLPTPTPPDVSGEVLTVVVVLSLLVTSQLAVTIVNWIATLLVTPHPLPRMDFSAGIPAEARTLVIVPTMLTSAANVEDLVEALEVRFLANRDTHLHFGLLTDFPDASAESLGTDAPLLALVEERINELNRKYGHEAHAPEPGNGNKDFADTDARTGEVDASHSAEGSVFYLFHRPRRWNATAKVWMGEERKRGKLGDLNSLLRGGHRDGFSLIVGATAILSQVRYVITLDTDTQLPRDAARQFVGAMAHPLNAARFGEPGKDTAREVVTSGHGILQPRVSVSLPGTNRSRYARLYGGEPGTDQYTRTVSDVYQDLFDEGSFIGKGIYDVDAFERALKGRFPANRILSHDLLEGCYARAGLLSDVELYEEFPARYSADVARRRRWIRGDWQLVGWLRRHVQGPDGRRERNPLSMLSQWKLFDNLRRSLVPAALALLLLLGWTVLARRLVLDRGRRRDSRRACRHCLAFRPGRQADRGAIPTASGRGRARCAAPDRAGRAVACVSALRSLLLPRCDRAHDLAYARSPAGACWNGIRRARSIARWSKLDRTDLLASYRSMAVAPAIAVAAWIGLSFANPAGLAVAGPILLLWAASPAMAWWISRPLPRRSAKLSADQARFLRQLARRTWAYFETYVGPDDHWLPPDNVQEHPTVTVAHRTSPTNMGLALACQSVRT